LPPVPEPPPTQYEDLIDNRLRQTRRQVKGVDLAGGVITLAIGLLVYLLAAAVIDHWLVAGGLGYWGRLLLWAGLFGGGGAYFVRFLLPPLAHRINPIFAAATIEQSQPSLKNSIVNFLLLRGHRQEVAPVVYQAMEYRAAADLSRVRVEVAVDRTHVIRLGYALVAVVALFSLYVALSNKSTLRSAGRILWPWSTIEAPTRVHIRDMQPGDASAFHGESVVISAEVTGLKEDEPVRLVYGTADGQSVDQIVPLTRPEGEFRYQCKFPPERLGLQQDCQYYLAAGDVQTRPFTIEVRVTPAMVVDRVDYHYPPYTGIADMKVERQGDLRAIEGTVATIHATANTDIKPGTAEIDLGCTGRRGVKMTADGRATVGQIALRLNPDDPARPEYDCYQLRFTDKHGQENRRPIRHRIEVVGDLPPEVQVTEPQREEVQVAEDGRLTIGLRAEDPDFALRRVVLKAEVGGKALPIPPLLDKQKPEKPWPGEFVGSFAFEPAKLGLKGGDRVQYWAEAEDNKEPAPNVSATAKQWIAVIGPERLQQPQPKPDRKQEEHPRQGKGSENKSDEGQPGQQANQDGQPQDKSQKLAEGERPAEGQPPKDGQPNDQPQDQGKQPSADQPKQAGGEKRTDRVDPDAEPGDAMQEILKDKDRQEKQPEQQPPDQQAKQGERQDNKQQDSGDKSAGEKSAGEKSAGEKSAGEKSGGEKSGGEKPAGEKSGGEKSGGEKSGGEKSGGEKSGGEKSGGEKAGGEKAGGEKTGAEKSGGEKAGGEKAGGEKTGGEKTGGEKTGGEKTGGEKTGGEKAGGEKAGGEKTGGEKTGGEKIGGEKTGGEKTGGEKTGGEKTGGEKSGGEKAADNRPPTEKPGADTSGGEKSGSKAGGENKPGEQQSTTKQEPGEKQPADGQQSPGAGKKPGDEAGSPAPQEDNQTRPKKSGQSGDAPGEKKSDNAQSPGTSKKQSDSQGETSGDRSGGGEQGGGQQANKPGVGGAGSNTAADEGGSKANEPGEGEIGAKAGDKAPAKKQTGSTAKQQAGEGEGTGQKKPGGKDEGKQPQKAGDSADKGTPQQNPKDGGTPGKQTSDGPGAKGSGNPTTGGKPGEQPNADAPPEAVETPAEKANLDYARKQTELALEHLRDQLAKEKPEVLERLGWTKEDARRFLDRWELMKQAAGKQGPAGTAARKQFDDALRSLGLRPRGTELRHGGMQTDQLQNLRDAGRFAPPPEWAEQFREYTRGVAGGGR
jgi:hypothetical protein